MSEAQRLARPPMEAEILHPPIPAPVHDLGPAIAESLAFDREVSADHSVERRLLYRESIVIMAILLFIVLRSLALS